MATPTTTFALIRAQWSTLIEALSPASHAEYRFREERGAADFREWAEQAPQACLRRFSVVNTTERVDPSIAISNSDVELQRDTAEILVAYPHALSLYGAERFRALQDMQRQDADQIRKAIGIEGGANRVSGQLVATAPFQFEDGDGVSFTRFDIEVTYYLDIAGV